MGCIPSKCSSSHVPAAAAVDSPKTNQLRHILTQSAIGSSAVSPHGLLLRYASLTQRGFYPDSPERENQDSFLICPDLQGNPSLHLFAVFDGHGLHGGCCSTFARTRLPQILAADPRLPRDPAAACAAAFPAANSDLRDSDIDDSMSGTTAISVLVSGKTLTISNVGDSRSVAGLRKGNSVVAEDLSFDQTPFRKDECERVKVSGARVLTVAQVEGITDPSVQTWGKEEDDDGDPPRVWVQDGMYPGTAFTRSLGDSIAEKIGVVADPEVLQVEITPEHLFFVLASDGVFEFLSSQAVVDMVAKFADPRDACSAVAAESYRRWLEHETRTDDITIIVVQIKNVFEQ